MSLSYKKSSGRIRTLSLVVLGIGGLLFLAAALIPASGAYFFDARDGTLSASSATFSMAVSKSGPATNPVSLEYKDLAPGKVLTDSFTVRNAGTIAGNLSLYSDTVDLGGMTQAAFNQLVFTVNGKDQLSPVSGNHLALGALQGGESKTVSVTAYLSSMAGNEWQGKSVTSALHLALEQAQ